MADDPKSYDDLLAEVEQSLAGAQPPAKPAGVPAKRMGGSVPATQEARGGAMPLPTRLLVFGGVAAALVFVIFLFVPLASAWSAAAGAFLGAAATSLVLRRR